MSKTIDELQRELAKKPIERSIFIDRDAVDGESRTVNLAFASDKPVEHYFGRLILSMDKKAMRSERLKSGAPLLMDHNSRDQIGVVEDVSIGTDGMARANVRFSRSARGEEILQDVQDGIRQNVSVGFMIYGLELVEEKKGEMPTYRCDDWEPMEISIVSMPADISVGVGRSKDFEGEDPTKQISNDSPIERGNSIQETTMAKENIETPESPVDVVRSKAELAADEVNRWGEQLQEQDLAKSYLRECIVAGTEPSKDGFFARIKAEQPETPKPQPLAATEHAKREGGIQLARTMPRFGTLRNFKGENAAEKALRFGQWFLAVRGIRSAEKFCSEHGVQVTRAMSEGVNESGGYLVPEEFGNDLIDLREQYGVFRRNAKMVPMSSDTRSDPRRTGGLTAYFEGEGDAGTASDKAWDRVSLTAKKLMVLARWSSEVAEDAVINMGDDLAGEIAYAFANKEDLCGFVGDGSSTYGGMQGVTTKIKGLSGTIANIAGLFVGAGNAYSELVLTDFEGVVGLLPQYADTPSAKWYVHRTFYWNVMAKLVLAAGGVTGAEIEGARKPRFLGYDVEVTQVMPKTEANSQVCALLGDLRLAASFGSRRDTTIAISEHSRFANDQIEIRGTERFDINVHDVGNASATAGSRVAGPVVGLITAAS
jgi:HK97 family phage major capsid protein